MAFSVNAKLRLSEHFYHFLTLFLLISNKKMLLLKELTTTIEPSQLSTTQIGEPLSNKKLLNIFKQTAGI